MIGIRRRTPGAPPYGDAVRTKRLIAREFVENGQCEQVFSAVIAGGTGLVAEWT
jgi:hypothetical protein